MGYWQPTKLMIALGARLVACGPDGPQAWAKAGEAYRDWKAGKKKYVEAERASRFKRGTVAAAFAEYRATVPWRDRSPAHARGLGARVETYRSGVRRRATVPRDDGATKRLSGINRSDRLN